MNKIFYVSVSGNDKNDGSINKPFKTLNFAFSQLEAGDTCILREGTYREEIKTSIIGSKENPITIVAFEGENVVISGTKIATEFEPYKENIVKTKVGIKTKQVFINNKMVKSARFPYGGTISKPKLYKFNAISEKMVDIGDGSKPKDFWKESIVWGVFNRAWVAQNGVVESSESYYVTIKENKSVWEKGIGKGT
jgi:hypothetical protein